MGLLDMWLSWVPLGPQGSSSAIRNWLTFAPRTGSRLGWGGRTCDGSSFQSFSAATSHLHSYGPAVATPLFVLLGIFGKTLIGGVRTAAERRESACFYSGTWHL